MTVHERIIELVGRRDSDRAGVSATRQSVTGYHCNVQGVTMCNRSLKLTAISHSSCAAEFYAASACARELLGLAELFKELHFDVAVRLEMDSDSARHILKRRTGWTQNSLKNFTATFQGVSKWIRTRHVPVSREGDEGTQAHRNSLLSHTTMDQKKTSIGWTRGYERQHSKSLHEISGWTANARDHERSPYQRNFGYMSLEARTIGSL